jgi:adenosylmethionine-8-amino-7-oxononanoate aminotransferase
VVQVAPPLICGTEELDFMIGTLREVLAEAATRR